MSKTSPFKVFSGTNSKYLAEKICNSLGCELGNMNITHFADGEFAVSFEESIRGAHVFLVQSTFPNSDNLMELLLMIDAAKRASAKSIVAVIPYFGWARQAGGRLTFGCRYRPFDYHGLACRPDSGFLQHSGRPLVCIRHLLALHSVTEP